MYEEWIDKRRLRHRFNEHIRLVNCLPSANTGTVKSQSFLKRTFVYFPDGHGKMLPKSRKIHES